MYESQGSAPKASGALALQRKIIETRSGPVSYLDVGSGPVALFVHGVGTNGYLWRNVIAAFQPEAERGERRLIAFELPGHGGTPARPGADVSLAAIAGYLEDFCAAAELSAIDLVANDTGGAIAQIFAARHPERLSTFTLTNCDTEGNLPPPAFEPTMKMARSGMLARLGPRLAKHPKVTLKTAFAGTYERPDNVPVDIIRSFLEPVMETKENAREFQRLLVAMDDKDLRDVHTELSELTVPTLLVWGTGDRFFGIQWAHQLRALIPGCAELVEVEGGRLFFPDERAAELVAPLREHWAVTVR